jgi:ribosome recycling factor
MNIYLESNLGDFEKAIEFFVNDISNLRTGRANPVMLEGIQVDAYGAKTPLNGLASITVPDGKSLLVAPWDKNIIKEIEKAITDADLGFGITNEGDKLRLSVPSMTEENRKEMVKILNEKQEAARVVIRQIREEIKTAIEQAEKDKEISEDEKFRFIKELDEVVKNKNDELKQTRDKKEQEIMTI